MAKRILLVEDEQDNREILTDLLSSLGYWVEEAEDGEAALAKLKLDIDLVLCDISMPGMDGYDLVRRIRELFGFYELPVIMVTGMAGQEDRLRAVEAGANDFIAKPVDLTELRVRTASQLRIKEQHDEIKQHKAELEQLVDRRTAALRESLEEMVQAQRRTRQAHLDTIHRLALAAEYKDMVTAEHIKRVAGYCATLARARGMSPGEVEMIYYASPMHDVGKIGIPDSILLKPGKLDPDEWEIMKRHTSIGARILEDSASELLEAGKEIALSHHEWWDGNGYPDGIAGEGIPLPGRICAVADVFDAIVTERPYKEAIPNERAYEIMKEKRGTHFDPELLDLFFDNEDRITTIQMDPDSYDTTVRSSVI